jgi:hypothetical protein
MTLALRFRVIHERNFQLSMKVSFFGAKREIGMILCRRHSNKYVENQNSAVILCEIDLTRTYEVNKELGINGQFIVQFNAVSEGLAIFQFERTVEMRTH